MSGLDKLITRAEKARINGNEILACQLEEIASEIERDFYRAKSGCAWRNLAEYMNGLLDGRYRDYDTPGIYRRCDGMEPFDEWLDKWYIPKPIDANGEPISFGKLYDCGCGAIDFIHVCRNNGEYGYSVESHDGYCFSSSDIHEQVLDSIEKLRRDICNAWNGSICSQNDYECADENCEVNEWLARAEKLFGGDDE